MSWWGTGSNTKEVPSARESSFSDNESISQQDNSVGTEAFQRALQAEQQKILIQAVMFKLTDLSFESCVQTPGTALNSTERNCIAAVATKYIDAGEIIASKMSGMAGQK
jgi:hypothetical protein